MAMAIARASSGPGSSEVWCEELEEPRRPGLQRYWLVLLAVGACLGVWLWWSSRGLVDVGLELWWGFSVVASVACACFGPEVDDFG